MNKYNEYLETENTTTDAILRKKQSSNNKI